MGNGPDPIVDIAIGRPPTRRRHADDQLDRFYLKVQVNKFLNVLGQISHGIVKLCKELRVVQRRHIFVRPSVNTNFMTISETALRLKRPVHDITADIEHGGFLVILGQKVVEHIMGAIRTIVETIT
jgi:hypothetical protein